MQWLMRIVCVGYFIFLTLLLLTTDPAKLIGMRRGLPWILQTMMPLAHTISFLTLAVLALMTRWPVPRWGIVLILAIYGGMTEAIQSRVPHRTPEWTDWCQDLAGIALGTACCWGVAILAGALSRARQNPEQPPSASSLEWTVMRKLLQRSTLGERSWWN
jgi:VanZ family protein